MKRCGFHGARTVHFYGRESEIKTEVEMKVKELKNGKAAVKDDVTGGMMMS